MQNATTKYCPKCKADKPIDGFSRNRSTADGRWLCPSHHQLFHRENRDQ